MSLLFSVAELQNWVDDRWIFRCWSFQQLFWWLFQQFTGRFVHCTMSLYSFTVLNTRLEDFFAVKIVGYIHQSSYGCISVIVHIKSAFTFHIYIYSFKVTSNENIHTYSSMCIVVVHSNIHLGSSIPSFFSSSPSQYVAFNKRVGRYNDICILHEGFFWYSAHLRITWIGIDVNNYIMHKGPYNFDNCTHICRVIRQMVICIMIKQIEIYR